VVIVRDGAHQRGRAWCVYAWLGTISILTRDLTLGGRPTMRRSLSMASGRGGAMTALTRMNVRIISHANDLVEE